MVTRQPHDVGQTLALAAAPLAHAVVTCCALAALGAQGVARALCGSGAEEAAKGGGYSLAIFPSIQPFLKLPKLSLWGAAFGR